VREVEGLNNFSFLLDYIIMSILLILNRKPGLLRKSPYVIQKIICVYTKYKVFDKSLKIPFGKDRKSLVSCQAVQNLKFSVLMSRKCFTRFNIIFHSYIFRTNNK